MRGVPDSNIYISALNHKGLPLRLLEMAVDGTVDLFISPPILSETLRVLRDKFDWNPERLEGARALLAAATRMVEPSRTLDVVRDDPSDNRILECALAAGANFVVTGDKHLLRIGRYEDIEIVTVREFLARAQGQPS